MNELKVDGEFAPLPRGDWRIRAPKSGKIVIWGTRCFQATLAQVLPEARAALLAAGRKSGILEFRAAGSSEYVAIAVSS